MSTRRVIFTVSRTIDEFLERMTQESGMDLSNLMRSRLWEWYIEERDRTIAERQLRQREPKA